MLTYDYEYSDTQIIGERSREKSEEETISRHAKRNSNVNPNLDCKEVMTKLGIQTAILVTIVMLLLAYLVRRIYLFLTRDRKKADESKVNLPNLVNPPEVTAEIPCLRTQSLPDLPSSFQKAQPIDVAAYDYVKLPINELTDLLAPERKFISQHYMNKH